MRIMHLGLATAGLILVSHPVFGETTSSNTTPTNTAPTLVVTAERYPIDRDKTPTSITVIDREQIEASQAQDLAELLRGIPGVDVVQSGGAGGNTALFLRGANAEHTVVYIDGVEANDPMAATRTFDFANFGVENIDSIEIVRGPQSVLYGSDAIGGVILINTKTGRGVPSGFISAEGGSYGSSKESAVVSGGDDTAGYSFAVNQRDTDGFSSAGRQYGNTEKDGYDATNVSGKIEVAPSKLIDLSLVLRYSNARTELDNFGGAYGDDPNRVIYDNNLASRAEIGTHLLDGKLNQKIGFSFTDQWYSDDNGADIAHPMDMVQSNYTGKMAKFDFQNIFKIADSVSGIVGYENKTEMGSSSYVSESSFGPFVDILNDRSVTSNGYYTQATLDVGGGVSAIGGVRVDDHSKFGTKTTWKAGPVVKMGDTKLSGTVGTGYKAPSIYQLYSSYGNEDLKAEESTGWDVGIEQEFINGDVLVGATYFHNSFDNLITFDPTTFISENINQATTKGVELYTTLNIVRDLSMSGSYTFTDTQDDQTDNELLRRPRNKGKLTLEYKPTRKLTMAVDGLFNGKRLDNDFSTFPASEVTLHGYASITVRASYRLTDHWEFFARGENILDKNYEEVLGYGTTGAAVFGGVKYLF